MSQHNNKGLGSLSEDDHDPYSAPHIYYGENNLKPIGGRPRTLSGTFDPHEVTSVSKPHLKKPVRRASVDTYTSNNPKKFTVNVANTQYKLLENEDTDGNFQITIEDGGPKVLRLGTANSSGYKTVEIRGTYMLSNLLQELTHAADHGRSWIILDERRLHENPVNRLTRLIKHSFWNGLTRNIDGSNIADVAKDPKAERMKDPRPRVYVPIGAPEQMEYYKRIAQKYPDLNLDVVQLPELIDAAYVKSINDKPGILALAMETYKDDNGKDDMRGWPYVVPGGRFNELYGWDSYMIALGLLIDGRLDLAKSMVINFCFEIKHYGKILNANRSYYLSRSQPPFLTDMALRVFKKMDRNEEALNFLKTSILAAIKEYYTVWMSAPRYDPATRLSRYRPDGLGVPPETEPSHFDTTIGPHAKKNGMGIEEFITAYNDETIKAPELDEYFLHDRAVRESGHDTTYRLEGCCADLATVDLNSLLYKYEVDIGQVLQKYFGGKLSIPSEFAVPGHPKLELGSVSLSGEWERAARDRKLAMERFMWNEDKGMFFDFNTKTYRQMNYESATTFWTMWAGCATPRQAAKMVEIGLPKFEKLGGLVSGTEESRGAIGLDRPNRQWDYPYGWAPQQILAWVGLEKYGYQEEVQRLAYRWLFMITKAFIDYNGVVVEKYDVTRVTDPHRVDAEYGNQGLGFKGVAREGFGWVNASYQLGLTFVTSHMRRAIGACIPPDDFLSASKNERSLLLNKWGASPPTSTSNSPFTSCASSFGITPEDEIVAESL